MNIIAAYVIAKEKMCREIAEKTAQLYLEGMSYEEAFKMAKEMANYDDFIGNSNGTVHKVTADANGNVTATVKFTGTGIDVYALTNQTGGKVYAKLYSSDGKLKKSLLRDYSYLTGELFHVPVISFNGFAKDTYTLQLTIMKGSTFYLDGVRIYNPLGTDIDQLPAEAKEAYKADGELGSQLA